MQRRELSTLHAALCVHVRAGRRARFIRPRGVSVRVVCTVPRALGRICMTEVRFQLALYVHLHRVDAIQDRLLERAAIAGAERS